MWQPQAAQLVHAPRQRRPSQQRLVNRRTGRWRFPHNIHPSLSVVSPPSVFMFFTRFMGFLASFGGRARARESCGGQGARGARAGTGRRGSGAWPWRSPSSRVRASGGCTAASAFRSSPSSPPAPCGGRPTAATRKAFGAGWPSGSRAGPHRWVSCVACSHGLGRGCTTEGMAWDRGMQCWLPCSDSM